MLRDRNEMEMIGATIVALKRAMRKEAGLGVEEMEQKVVARLGAIADDCKGIIW